MDITKETFSFTNQIEFSIRITNIYSNSTKYNLLIINNLQS